jgi:hypothetical protein
MALIRFCNLPFGFLRLQGLDEAPDLRMTAHSAEGFFGFEEADCGPAQRHVSVLVLGDATTDAEHH